MTTSSFSFCLRLVLAMAGAGMFAACDPGVVYNQIVQNDSSHDIWVYTYGLATDPDQPVPVLDSTLIPAGVTSSIYEYSHMGTVGLFTACRSFAYDSLSSAVVSPDSLRLIPDLNDVANWRYTVIDKTFGGGGSCECRMLVDDGMME